ncbi:MAG: DUF4440 domain-containing protein [Phaeodactylibacter sp.]|nr:DUF4440 domain-containing protein [Phaeodactylibacter sp.]MCB9296707.1 DUF4440 domain-containing protein [Lewinellaceae bacterium]
MRTTLLLISMALFATACQLSRRAGSGKEAETAMQAAYDTFTKAYRQADPAMVANLYTTDAYYLEPNALIIQGRDAIQANFARYLGRFTPGAGPDITFEIIDRRISGNQGYDIGYYLNDGKRAGKFIVLWQRQPDGKWLIRGDGFSGLGGG